MSDNKSEELLRKIALAGGTASMLLAASLLGGQRQKEGREEEWGSLKMDSQIKELLMQVLELDELSEERLKKLESCKYLIALDMGCGSTSAAIVDLENLRQGTAVEECILPILWRYEQPSIETGEYIEYLGQVSIPTLIGYSGSQPTVGPRALRVGNVCENFKACPNEQNLKQTKVRIANNMMVMESRTLKQIWMDYFANITEMICAWCDEMHLGPANRLNMKKDTLLMVAHPAGSRSTDGVKSAEWAQPNVLNSYRALVTGGTGLPDENVLTISEAKAAMQYVRRKFGRQLDFKRGVVLVDIGASTSDVEYLAKGLSEPREYSLTMAGRDVDALLLHYALEELFPAMMEKYGPDELPEDDFFVNEARIMSKRSEVKFSTRMFKERISNLIRESSAVKSLQYPIGMSEVELSTDTLTSLLGEERVNPLTGAVFGKRSFTKRYPKEIAEYTQRKKGLKPDAMAVQQVEDTWYGHLENLIRFVMDKLADEGREVGQVIITGGSCRLPGIEEHIWRAIQDTRMGNSFANQKNIICMDKDNDCENAVPFGGGYYVGGVLAKLGTLQQFSGNLRKKLSDELSESASEAIADEVDKLVNEIVKDSMKWWAGSNRSEDESSINALNKHIKSECSRIFNQTDPKQNQLEQAVQRGINSLTPEKNIPQTLQAIDKLLDTLAGAKFSGKVKTSGIKLQPPAKVIAGAVKEVDPGTLDLGILAEVFAGLQDVTNGVANVVRGLFGQDEVSSDDLPRTEGYRKKARDAYKNANRNTVSYDLQDDIAKLLRKEFKKTDICGIPDQIIASLRQDMIQALYLN